MNSLSWFLYLADVIGNVRGLLILFSTIFGAGTFVWLFAKGCVAADDDKSAKKFAHFMRFAPWIFVSATFLAAIIPSRDTIYLIAGSEAGEAVVTSEAGQEILNDIKEVIQFQLSELKGENKSSDTP